VHAAQIDILRSLDNDMASLIWGVSAGLVSSFFVALYPLLLKRSMVSLDNWQISIHVNLMSLLWFDHISRLSSRITQTKVCTFPAGPHSTPPCLSSFYHTRPYGCFGRAVMQCAYYMRSRIDRVEPAGLGLYFTRAGVPMHFKNAKTLQRPTPG